MRRKTLFLTLTLSLALPAAASVLLPLTVEDMAAKAELVLVGQVNQVRYEEEDGSRLYTRVLITPEEMLKGQAKSPTVEVKFIGGRKGDLVAEMPGAPTFRAGEKVLVFLEPRQDRDGYLTLAMYLGKFEIVRDPQSGRELAVRGPKASGVSIVVDNHPVEKQDVMVLDDIRALVRKVGGGK